MKTIHLFMAFIALALAQIFVPANMIYGKEVTLANGALYKFKTRPVDPYDPFKGKYITLRFEDAFYDGDNDFESGEEVYVRVANDSAGFAKIIAVQRTEFDYRDDYFKAKVRYGRKGGASVRLIFPFDEYYMEETKAYDAEAAYREAARDTLPYNTYAEVMIFEGEAVLKDVIINEISIKDYVDEKGQLAP